MRPATSRVASPCAELGNRVWTHHGACLESFEAMWPGAMRQAMRVSGQIALPSRDASASVAGGRHPCILTASRNSARQGSHISPDSTRRAPTARTSTTSWPTPRAARPALEEGLHSGRARPVARTCATQAPHLRSSTGSPHAFWTCIPRPGYQAGRRCRHRLRFRSRFRNQLRSQFRSRADCATLVS